MKVLGNTLPVHLHQFLSGEQYKFDRCLPNAELIGKFQGGGQLPRSVSDLETD